jgi:hypothetical protein
MKTITHVAIRFQDNIYSLPKPNRHHNVIWHIVNVTGIKPINASGDNQGFLDSEGQYLTRKEALDLAVKAGQLKPDALGLKQGKLYSEDIW